MKKTFSFYKLKLATVFTVLIMTAGSCDKFLDVNIDPNLTVDNPPNLILPSAGSMLGFVMGSDLNRYSLLWSQQIAAQAGRQTETYDTYTLQPTEVNNVFRTNIYGGILMDLERILAKPTATTHPHYYGIAKIMKAFTYIIASDCWGDVPFTEALQGDKSVFQPKTDPSQAVYTSALRLLDEGIAEMRKTAPPTIATVGNDDYFYGGSANAIRWVRFANSVKLRIYLHWSTLSNADRAAMTSFINGTPATDFMQSTADDFNIAFETTARRQNPIHQFILDRQDDITTSSTLVDMMNTKVDPRRTTYFTPMPFSMALLAAPPTGNTGYVGLRNGTGGGLINNNYSRIHTYTRGAVTGGNVPGPSLGVTGITYAGNAPVRILSFAEYSFIRAEFALRFNIGGDAATAQTFYQAGVRASMANAGISATATDAYIAAQGTLTGSVEDQLKKLIEEKFVANFMVAVEPWNDWRRTGYPLLNLLPTTVNAGNNRRVPRVLPYPQQEVDANPNMKQRTSLSETPVFWDVRTTGQQ